MRQARNARRVSFPPLCISSGPRGARLDDMCGLGSLESSELIDFGDGIRKPQATNSPQTVHTSKLQASMRLPDR